MRNTKAEKYLKIFKEKYSDKYKYKSETIINSYTKIPIECDCGNIFYMSAYDHTRYGCPKCGIIQSNKNRSYTQEQYIEKLIAVHGDKFDTSKLNYNGNKNKILLGCKENPDHGYFEISPVEALRGHGCSKCGGNYSMSNEEYIIALKKIHGDRYDLSLINFTGSRNRVIGVCKDHGQFTLRADHFLKGGNCPQCARLIAVEKTKSNITEFKEKFFKLYGDIYSFDNAVYTGSQDELIATCKVHGNFNSIPSRLLQGYGCPKCNRSKGEELIEKLLLKNGIEYIEQFTFSNYDFYHKYDFYLPLHKVLIEFHGEQHFRSVDYFGGQRVFEKIKERDEKKIKLAKKKNIPLIEFIYKDLELSEIEFEELLLKRIEQAYQNHNGIFNYDSKVKLVNNSIKEINHEKIC